MDKQMAINKEKIKRVVNDFHQSGTSISDWAGEHNFNAWLVYKVLQGERKCLRGQSHRIAVALGLKGKN